jgi:hypothetical protein
VLPRSGSTKAASGVSVISASCFVMCSASCLMPNASPFSASSLASKSSSTSVRRTAPMYALAAAAWVSMFNPTPCSGKKVASALKPNVLLALRLAHDEVVDDLPHAIQPKDVDTGPIAVVRPVLVTVKDDKITFCENAPELDALARILACHALEVLDERLLPVGDPSNINTIDLAGMPPGPHKILIELVNANHEVFPGQSKTVTFGGRI